MPYILEEKFNYITKCMLNDDVQSIDISPMSEFIDMCEEDPETFGRCRYYSPGEYGVDTSDDMYVFEYEVGDHFKIHEVRLFSEVEECQFDYYLKMWKADAVGTLSFQYRSDSFEAVVEWQNLSNKHDPIVRRDFFRKHTLVSVKY